jgi:hypothetical protein
VVGGKQLAVFDEHEEEQPEHGDLLLFMPSCFLYASMALPYDEK